ncbi:protein late bloomer [Glossina fuscipes]|uniref:Protein late bloomer n=1 Tax=Glossina fuscipes TaxID=7396 RepID=A0A8U0WLD4_9MUSC|nr:protein late bloomer [Glossina fuscipes]
MGCPSGAMKCVLNAMNAVLAVLGILMIALATVSLQTAPPAYVIYLYVLGSVNFFAAMLGCCGICREHFWMTATYTVIILASLVSQIIRKAYAFDSDAIKEFATADVERTWLNEIQNPGAMDKTQETYKCCGKIGPNDYANINRPYPASCYRKMTTSPYEIGCIAAAQKKFLEIFNYSSNSAWGNLAYTAIIFAFAFYLVMRFRRKQ